ncbi:hypothetical protein VCHENC02_2737, partial [Vibrio harveyi]
MSGFFGRLALPTIELAPTTTIMDNHSKFTSKLF